jgi:hypothetical protein
MFIYSIFCSSNSSVGRDITGTGLEHDIGAKRIMLRLLTQVSFLRIERRPARSTAPNNRWLRGII